MSITHQVQSSRVSPRRIAKHTRCSSCVWLIMQKCSDSFSKECRCRSKIVEIDNSKSCSQVSSSKKKTVAQLSLLCWLKKKTNWDLSFNGWMNELLLLCFLGLVADGPQSLFQVCFYFIYYFFPVQLPHVHNTVAECWCTCEMACFGRLLDHQQFTLES